MLGHEIAVGLILGTLIRLITSATQVAGATIAFQVGLSMAQTADPSQKGVQGAVIGNFLSMLALALIFAMDLHHLLLAAIRDSYGLFPPDAPLMFDDAAKLALGVVSRAFALGMQISAPFIVFGLVFNLGLGLLAQADAATAGVFSCHAGERRCGVRAVRASDHHDDGLVSQPFPG